MIFSVLACASAGATNGADIAGARPAAPAAAPARFRKPRRVMLELNFFPSDRIGCLLRRRLTLSGPQLRLYDRRHLGRRAKPTAGRFFLPGQPYPGWFKSMRPVSKRCSGAEG